MYTFNWDAKDLCFSLCSLIYILHYHINQHVFLIAELKRTNSILAWNCLCQTGPVTLSVYCLCLMFSKCVYVQPYGCHGKKHLKMKTHLSFKWQATNQMMGRYTRENCCALILSTWSLDMGMLIKERYQKERYVCFASS